jgi:predicted ATPase
MKWSNACCQDAAYQSLLRRTRLRLHHAVAQMFGGPNWPRVDAGVAAHHFVCAEQYAEATSAWQLAGQEAARRSAYVEAAGQFENALQALAEQPAGESRDRTDLELQVSLGRVYCHWSPLWSHSMFTLMRPAGVRPNGATAGSP